jgi:hypothetical protein
MSDKEIGAVELTATVKIVFGIGVWQGRRRGGFRKFVASNRYTGPTPSGLSLEGVVLSQLLIVLKRLAAIVPTGAETIFASIGKKNTGSEIRVTILSPDGESTLPSVDIREFVQTTSYAGPTKKGVRFPWDKLRQFTQLLEVLVHDLGTAVEGDPTLFPDVKPTWVNKVSQECMSGEKETPAVEGFDAVVLRPFPSAFLPNEEFDAERISLPPESLKIMEDRDGRCFVTNRGTFHRQVRNEVEGKFFVYAQQRGHTELRLPKEMFKVFSAVAGYEKYCRELRQKLVHDLEARSRNRQLAEHIAREMFQARGLPYC